MEFSSHFKKVMNTNYMSCVQRIQSKVVEKLKTMKNDIENSDLVKGDNVDSLVSELNIKRKKKLQSLDEKNEIFDKSILLRKQVSTYSSLAESNIINIVKNNLFKFFILTLFFFLRNYVFRFVII